MADKAERLADLTARTASLEAELALYRDAVESMHQGLCMFDPDGRITLVNRRYAEILRLPPESVHPGMTGTEVVQLCVDAGKRAGQRGCRHRGHDRQRGRQRVGQRGARGGDRDP